MDKALPDSQGLLMQFVSLSGWQTTRTSLIEALPHLTETVSAEDSIAALRNLGLPLTFAEGTSRDLAVDDLPALGISSIGEMMLVTDLRDGRIRCEGAGTPADWVPTDRAPMMFVRIDRQAALAQAAPPTRFMEILSTFRTTWIALFFVSFVTNVMALGTPVLIMVIYDRAIPSGATELIVWLALAAGLVMVTDLVLRLIRARAVAHMGAAIEGRLSLLLFRKLAAIPLGEVEKSDVDQQIARLKQFEGMRDLFAGPVFTTLLDIPFILLFIGLLTAISPLVGGVVAVAVLMYALLGWITIGPLARRNSRAAQARTAHQKLVFETLQAQRDLARLGMHDIWRGRHLDLADQSAVTAQVARQWQLSSHALGQLVMGVAGIGAIFLGTHLAIVGNLSFGALIAIMSLVWKSLAPVHALYTSLPQIQGFLNSRRQIDRVLSLREEFTRGAARSDVKRFTGSVSVAGLSYRFPKAANLALSQLSFAVEPGECVVITGPNQCGKSTLLDLLAGLYTPLAGTLYFDGVTVAQIAVDDLRHMVGYARQRPQVFHGTLWQNFQMAAPDITREDALRALQSVGLDAGLRDFPDGLDTRLGEGFRKTLPPATLQQISLARCLARDTTIQLLDDPTAGLDTAQRATLASHLATLKRQCTLVIATDDPGLIQIADRLVYLEGGRLVFNDVGDPARRKLLAMRNRKNGAGS